jgi:lipid-A-disaccharide synthase
MTVLWARTDLYITSNSPGELLGWAAPVVREVRRRKPATRVTLVILPCPYASGQEEELARESGADRVVRIGRIKDVMESDGAAPENGGGMKRLALHLGGDVAFSVYLSRRLKCPLWVYASRPRWRPFVDRYFVPDEKAAERFKAKRAIRHDVVGNIALDSVTLSETEEETRAFLGLGPDEPVMSCLVGSRPLEYTEGIKLFAGASRLIAEKFPNLRVLFPLAPTVTDEGLRNALERAGVAWSGESRVRGIDIGGGRLAIVVRGRTLEALNCSKLALLPPGTNNLQAAALYTPFIVALPLDRADEFPLDGLPGIIPLWVPGYRKFKRRLIERANERTSLISIPNKMAGRMIAPEIRGYFGPGVVARMAIGLLESPGKLREMSRAFWELTGGWDGHGRVSRGHGEPAREEDEAREAGRRTERGGAAGRIAEEIAKFGRGEEP